MPARRCFVKYIIAWPPLGQAKVPLALERLEHSEENRFATGLAAKRQEGVKRGERSRSHSPVRNQVGIVGRIAIERGQRALKEGDRDRRSHVYAGVEQLRGDTPAAFRHLVQVRAEPIEAPVDRSGFLSRKLAHRGAITVRASNRFGDPETGRPALVRRIGDKAALALDQRIDQIVHVNRFIHRSLLSSRG